MKRVGLVGWRGMVGSVLMGRMLEEQDFKHIDPVFFTTSNDGGQGPAIGKDVPPLKDAKSVDELKAMDIIIPCQGGDYTSEIFPKLRAAGWQGYWIDAASTLRMDKDAIIILDPVNLGVIKNGIRAGGKNHARRPAPRHSRNRQDRGRNHPLGQFPEAEFRCTARRVTDSLDRQAAR